MTRRSSLRIAGTAFGVLVAAPAAFANPTPLAAPAWQIQAVCSERYGEGVWTACAVRTDGGVCVVYLAEELTEAQRDERWVYWSVRCP